MKIVSGNELNAIWQQMNSAEKGLNPYENYVQKLKNEEKNKKDDTFLNQELEVDSFEF